MRARTGAMVLVGTAVVLLLLGMPGQFMAGADRGGAAANTNGAASGDIGAGASGGGDAASAGGRSDVGGGGDAGADVGAPGASDPPLPPGAAAGAPGDPVGAGDEGGRAAGRGGAADGAGSTSGAGSASASPGATGGAGAEPAVRTVERERILVLGSVFFPSGQAELGPDARRLLDGVAATYKGTTQRLEITGHTDTRGSAAVNAALSRARAEAVRGYLAASGIPERLLVVRYAGASRPMARGASSEDNAQNRRVELSVAAGP